MEGDDLVINILDPRPLFFLFRISQWREASGILQL